MCRPVSAAGRCDRGRRADRGELRPWTCPPRIAKAGGHRTERRRPLRRASRHRPPGRPVAIAAVVVAAGLSLLAPAIACAHAYLVTTSPPIGAVMRGSPSVVSLTYDESVTISPGALEVVDSAGRRVDSGVVTHPRADTIAVAVPRSLARGSYAVSWRVTSADTHVVHGVFTFSVGAVTALGGITGRLEARGQTSAVLSFRLRRRALREPAPAPALRRPARRRWCSCCTTPMSGSIGRCDADSSSPARCSRSPPCSGSRSRRPRRPAPVSVAGSPPARSPPCATRALARCGWCARGSRGLLAVVAMSFELVPPRRRGGRELVLIALAVALLLTPSAAGHASVGSPLNFVVDAAYVITAAAWLGGLAFVLAALAAQSGGGAWQLASRSVPRFSLLALLSVSLLIFAGVLNAIHEVGAWRGLWQSTYGELVLAKIALALPLLALGAFNNRLVGPSAAIRRDRRGRARALRPRRAGGACAARGHRRRHRRADRRGAGQERGGADELAQHVAPGRAVRGHGQRAPLVVGRNTITIVATSMRPSRPMIGEVDLAADPPSARVAPLNLKVRQRSARNFGVSGAVFTVAGTWHLYMTVRTGLVEYLARIPITVEPPPAA